MLDLDAIEVDIKEAGMYPSGVVAAHVCKRVAPSLIAEIREGLVRERNLALERNQLRNALAMIAGADVGEIDTPFIARTALGRLSEPSQDEEVTP